MPVTAVAALPWKEIITVLPSLVTTATRFWEQLKSQPHTAPVNPHDDPQKQIAALVQRLEALEAAQVEQAGLMKQMTEQLQGVSAGLAEVSRRYTLALLVSAGSFVFAIAALLFALAY